MSSSRFAVLSAAVCAGLVLGSSLAAHADPKVTPAPPKAKISPKQAAASATKKIAGTAQSTKYEYEDGHWQYAVVVKDKTGQLYEVEVNSTTGKVTDTEKTSAAEEVQEEAADKKKAAGASSKAVKEADEKDEKAEKSGK